MSNPFSAPGKGCDRFERFAVSVLVVLTLVLALVTPVNAHEVRPSIAELTVLSSGEMELQVTTNLEALVSEIGAEHDDTDDSPKAARYNSLRELTPASLETAFTEFVPRLLMGIEIKADGQSVELSVASVSIPEIGDVELPRASVIRLVGQVPTARTVTFMWAADFGASVLRVREEQGDITFTQFLRDGAVSDDVVVDARTQQGFVERFWHFTQVGFTHIVPKGLDHILFVVGLFLLSMRFGPLLMQITLFTVAHSMTLALAMLGIVTIPASVIEPAIAASIVYVCVENMFTDSVSRWRLVIVFLFGLLHGLGFASVLSDIGLEASEFVVGLIAFNVGVELGQIGVVLVCLLTIGLFHRQPWYRSRVTLPVSAIIGLVGVGWFVERVFWT